MSRENEVEDALNLGVITVAEHHHYLRMLKSGQSDILSIISDKTAEHKKKINNDLLDLYNTNNMKIGTYLGADGWKEMKYLAQNGFPLESVKKIVENLPESISLSAMIKNKNVVHDLDWYRKNNPKALQENPELYQSLLKSYKNQK